MTARQIHELDGMEPRADDLLPFSTALDRKTKQSSFDATPFRLGADGAADRVICDKLAEWPSVMDFGAVGDGAADETAAFAAALASGASVVVAPAGRYRLRQPLTLSEGQRLVGQGVAVSALWADQAGEAVVCAGEGCGVSHMRVDMDGADTGVALRAAGARLDDLAFARGAAGSFAIRIEGCDGFVARRIAVGAPGDSADLASGVLWESAASGAQTLFGGRFSCLRIHLDAVGVRLRGRGGGHVDGAVWDDVLIRASDPLGGVLAGSTGFSLTAVRNASITNATLRDLERGVREIGASAGGATNIGNRFAAVHVVNATTPYEDDNASLQGAVANASFIACAGFPQRAGFATNGTELAGELVVGGDGADLGKARFRAVGANGAALDLGDDAAGIALAWSGDETQLQPMATHPTSRLRLGRDSRAGAASLADVTIEPALRLPPRSAEN